ncbi:g6305 [Coccomyxa viridis]|uniref:Exocyst complex component Sec8 n=1 Tax=Coccomyxa viridis TaxID=1274662 RepID=A0ABP1FXM6_9CHLO
MTDELLGWAAQMPIFATHLTGVVENVLGQVLEAFQSRMTGLLGRCTCRALADNLQLAANMAKEPSAPQAGEAVAFFVGKNGSSDGVDAFVTSALNAGFGSGGEAAQIEVLQRIFQERPVRADALLGSADKVTGLAALSDSADYLAEVIARSGAMDVSAIGSSSRPSSPSRNQSTNRVSGMLTLGMSHLMDRYRSLAGHSLRALRLDLELAVLHYLQDLPSNKWACEEEEATEVDECAGALIRAASRAEEDLAPLLPARKRAYLFTCLGFAAARTIMWLLPEIESMNQHGIARMCRLLAVVQPALSSLGAAGAAFRPESARAFEKARAYYSLLTLPADGLIKAAAEKPKRFTSAEYMALLQVDYAGREVTGDHLSQLSKIVGAKDPKGRSLFASAASMPFVSTASMKH